MYFKKLLYSLLCVMMFFSCTQPEKTETTDANAFENMDTTKVLPTFFPVQTFILGEIETLSKSNSVITRVERNNEVPDSTKITLKEWKEIANALFYPAIDSLSLSSHFIENKFLDQSIGSITLTYEPNKNKPDSIPWENWNVYIHPENQEISRLFLVKKIGNNQIEQITWIPGKFCKVVMINEDPLCKLNKTKEQMFYWGK
jgi:hypothetical protein